jgi:putative tricarboxylic transport membrane protein
VLGPILERALRQSLQMSLGNPDIFVTRPMAAVLLLASVVAVAWPLVNWVRSRNRGRAARATPPHEAEPPEVPREEAGQRS